jgi:hypothetical protein
MIVHLTPPLSIKKKKKKGKENGMTAQVSIISNHALDQTKDLPLRQPHPTYQHTPEFNFYTKKKKKKKVFVLVHLYIILYMERKYKIHCT